MHISYPKRISWWTTLFLLIIFFCLPSHLLGKGKGPRIYFPKKMIEFGEALQGEDVVKIFTFQNRGDQPLKIVKIKSSCLCAPSLLSKKILQPGEEGKIKVSFHTLDLVPQYYDLYVDIFHNDPHEKDNGPFVSRLYLSGRVIMIYQIYPLEGGYLGTFEVSSPPKRTYKILTTVGKGFVIKKIEYPKKKIRLQVKPLPLSGGRLGQQLTVQVLPNQPPGEFVAPLKIYTSHPRQPVLYFKIWGMGLGEVVAEPSYLLFGPTRRKGNRQRRISIFLRHGTGLKILGVEIDSKFFTLQQDELLAGKKFELTLTIRKDVPVGPFAKEIRIFTNHPRQPFFQIPILGTIEREIQVYPKAFLLRKKDLGKWKKIQIFGPTDLTLQVSSLPKKIETKLEKKGKGHYFLQIRCSTFLPQKDSLTLETNQPGEKRLLIPILFEEGG